MSDPCTMQAVILRQVEIQGEFKGLISGMADDIAEIKARVNNGLTLEITKISKELAQSVADSKEVAAKIKSEAILSALEVKADVALSASKLEGENWLVRIVTGSVAKLIGVGVVVIILSGLTSSGMLLIKDKYTKEPEQKQIIGKLDTIISSTPEVLTVADIENIKAQFVKEIRLEFDRQAKMNKFKGDTGKTGAVGKEGEKGKNFFGR